MKKIYCFITHQTSIIVIWFVAAIVIAIKQYTLGSYNNYKIFKYVFIHTWQKRNLYLTYPHEYFDHNHYGPLFSIVFAPFAWFPDYFGMLLWAITLTGFLIYALLQLPLSSNQKTALLWICLNEFITAMLSFQFNIAIAGIIILAYVYIIRQQEIKSAWVILIGAFVKLYGIVGLVFFTLSKNKMRFFLSGIIVFALCLCLPMLFSSPQFILQSYADWFHRLIEKNDNNAVLYNMQDISVMGLVRRIFNMPDLSNTPILLCSIILFALPQLKIKTMQSYVHYQLLILASTLIFTVIFSSGAESPTYIIAFVGVALWFVLQEQKKSPLVIFLFVLAFVLTTLSPTDIFPKWIREQYVIKYSLKALPCLLIWLHLFWQMMTYKHEKSS